MGSPSRNVQYHPPRLSEDRLNLPQPHSPSLPTHCSGKSGMRPTGTLLTESLDKLPQRRDRRQFPVPPLTLRGTGRLSSSRLSFGPLGSYHRRSQSLEIGLAARGWGGSNGRANDACATCTGALRRRLPTGHPRVFQLPPSVPGWTFVPVVGITEGRSTLRDSVCADLLRFPRSKRWRRSMKHPPKGQCFPRRRVLPAWSVSRRSRYSAAGPRHSRTARSSAGTPASGPPLPSRWPRTRWQIRPLGCRRRC